MKAPQDVIIKPIITEKSMQGLAEKKYTFEVAKDSNKIEIAQAVEAIFGKDIKVAKVNTINVRGKNKRVGAHIGLTRSWKKAIVKLSEGSKTIEFFDSLM